MRLEEILEEIKSFNTSEETEDYEITEFFDKIGDDFSNLDELEKGEKNKVVKILFDFLKRQSPELEENWSFIHLIENIEDPTYGNYHKKLFNFNKQTPTLTSILLLNRLINSLKNVEFEKGIKLLKEISEKIQLPELLKEEAKGYYEYQLKKIDKR